MASYGQLKHVNTTDIAAAVQLGCRTMQRLFNADDNDMPFMAARARPNPALWMSANYDGHVPGRHLNALLTAESVLDIELDEEAIAKHRRAALFSYSGPVPLPLGRPSVDAPLRNVGGHNLREGFHALYALTAFRDDRTARELAERSIAAVFELWDPENGWDLARLDALGLVVEDNAENFTRTLPRAIGPLVKYYRATGYGPALKLALVFRDKLLADHFLADGGYSIERLGTHGHSIACDLSSLAQLADLTGDLPLMERVCRFYDNGMWQLRDALGWVVEKTGPDAVERPDVGEGNSTGDLIETALILGRWGRPACYEDAERMLRCHLLPSQLRDAGFIEDPEIADRLLGGWGFPAPYGHEPLELCGWDAVHFHADIVGGVVGSLCAAHCAVTQEDTTGHRVELLFDHETDALRVRSPYTHDALTITLKRPGGLWIRVPSWVQHDRIAYENFPGTPHRFGAYLFLPDLPVNVPLHVRYELPERQLLLHHRTRDIRVQLRGDAVRAMDNFGADLTFFDSLD
jgi:hypothetical protein